MSRVGNQSIAVPDKVKVSIADNHVARLWQSGIQMRQVFEPDVLADVCVVASRQQYAELSIVVRVVPVSRRAMA